MSEEAKIEAGGSAPEAALESKAGERVRLSDLWGEGPLVLVFLRHLG